MNKIAKNLLLSLTIAAPVALSVSAVKAEAPVLGNTPTGTEVSTNTSNLGQYTVAYLHRHRLRHHIGGTYRQSCTNEYIDGNGTLQAMCKNRYGNWQPTSLENASNCVNAENIDGRLQCKQLRGVPNGSYLGSCQYYRVNGDTLYADCKDQNRHWRRTSLNNFSQCAEGSISNLNGHLTCPR